MKLSKDTIEFIDQICEDSVNHPVVVGDANISDDAGDDYIAGIAQFIAISSLRTSIIPSIAYKGFSLTAL